MSLQQQKCSGLLERFPLPIKELSENGSFGVLFENQMILREKLLGPDSLNLTDKQISDQIRLHIEAMIHETSELRELLAWKHWKQYPDNFSIDKEEARFEVADLMCFLMNIAILLGMSGDELLHYTYAKQKHNVERQEDPKLGYVK